MPPHLSRRRLLKSTAAGLSVIAVGSRAQAQKPLPPDEFSVPAPVAIEVHARPITWFDNSDHDRVRFGALEFRSGLVLTSSFRAFGGLSGLRLDAQGERFISFSDKGTWFTGRIVYQGRAMSGLTDVEAAPMLGPTAGRSPAAAGSIRNRSRSMGNRSISASSASTRCCVSISAR